MKVPQRGWKVFKKTSGWVLWGPGELQSLNFSTHVEKNITWSTMCVCNRVCLGIVLVTCLWEEQLPRPAVRGATDARKSLSWNLLWWWWAFICCTPVDLLRTRRSCIWGIQSIDVRSHMGNDVYALRRKWDLVCQSLLPLKRKKRKDCSWVPNLESESSQCVPLKSKSQVQVPRPSALKSHVKGSWPQDERRN